MDLITSQNWNYCGLRTRQLRAFVGMGAMPGIGSNSPDMIYCVTVSDEDFQEIHQKDFDTLEKALSFINVRYGEWEFYNLQEGEGGCGSCSAH